MIEDILGKGYRVIIEKFGKDTRKFYTHSTNQIARVLSLLEYSQHRNTLAAITIPPLSQRNW